MLNDTWVQKYLTSIPSGMLKTCIYFSDNDCTVAGSGDAPSAPAEKAFVPIEPKLQIDIPTLQFSKIVKEGQYINVPYLADYIAGIYKYAVAIVSIIAIVMIMVGGLRWMTAGGNASAVGGAKEMISGATIGLLLVLGSYTVLYTVNPDLVSFKALQIEYIKPDPVVVDWTDEDLKAVTGEATASGSNNVPLFFQFKEPWKDTCCGHNPSPPCKSTIWKAGCGLTSYAMVLKYYFPNKDITPLTTARLASSYCSIGAISASKLSDVVGPVTITNPRNINEVQKLVSQGKPVIINCRPCIGLDKTGALSPRKYGGHLMVLTGYNNGTFSVNDPGGYLTSMTIEMIANPCKFVFPSDDPKKAEVAIANCNKKATGQSVNTKPGFWYLRPAGK